MMPTPTRSKARPAVRRRRRPTAEPRVPSLRHRVVLCAIYTATLACIPWPAIWESARGIPMRDRAVYAEQIVTGNLRSDYSQPGSLLAWITDEYLWSHILNFLTRTIGLPIEVAFALISAFAISAAAFLILRRARAHYLLLLINPLFIDLTFSQLRIALAMGILVWLYACGLRSKLLVVTATLFSCAIHTAMVLVLGLFLLSTLVGRRYFTSSRFSQYLALCAAACGSALTLGPLRAAVLAGFGDRRALVEYDQVQSGLSFYLIWILILVLLSANWRLIHLSTCGRFAVAMLWTSLLTAVLGGYADRLLAISLPFFIVASSRIAKDQIWILWLGYIGFTGLHWLYWLTLL